MCPPPAPQIYIFKSIILKTTELSSIKFNSLVVEYISFLADWVHKSTFVFPKVALKAHCTVLGDCVRACSGTQNDFSLRLKSMAQPENKTKINH